MTSDAPKFDPTISTDRAIAVDAVADPPEGVRPIGIVAPSLASVAVVPAPPVVAAAHATDRADLVDALERLRGALVSAGRSLDVVAAAARAPERAR